MYWILDQFTSLIPKELIVLYHKIQNNEMVQPIGLGYHEDGKYAQTHLTQSIIRKKYLC